MKKTGYIIFSALILMFVCAITVCADTNSDYNDAYSVIEEEKLEEFLDKTNSSYFEDNGIDIKDVNWIDKVSVSSFFAEVVRVVKNEAAKPVRVFFSFTAIILVCAAFTGNEAKIGLNKTVSLVAVSVVSLIVFNDVWGLVTLLVTTVKNLCDVISVFIPVFEAALFMSGKVTASAASSGMLIMMTDGLGLAANNYVLPIMGAYLGIGTVASVTPFVFIKQLGEALKKASVILLSAVFSVFVGITGMQTLVNSSADNLTVKTSKFIIGTFIPIGGGALGEAANTVYSSMSLVKSSVGVYGVVSIAIICLPVIILAVMFKIVFLLSNVIARSFSQNELSNLISVVDSFLSVVLSVVLFFAAVFVFSIALIWCLSN